MVLFLVLLFHGFNNLLMSSAVHLLLYSGHCPEYSQKRNSCRPQSSTHCEFVIEDPRTRNMGPQNLQSPASGSMQSVSGRKRKYKPIACPSVELWIRETVIGPSSSSADPDALQAQLVGSGSQCMRFSTAGPAGLETWEAD